MLMSYVIIVWMWELFVIFIKKVICNKVLFVLNFYIIREVNFLLIERFVIIINFRGGKFVSFMSILEIVIVGVIVVFFEY